MVMGKVSKAIAASFLCLLFNGSGTTTNAMEEELKQEVVYNNINAFQSGNVQNGEVEGRPNGSEDNKKTNIWQIIIPAAAVVGGFGLGAILGKFVF